MAQNQKLTVRLDEALLRALKRRAELRGCTTSDLVRQILERAVSTTAQAQHRLSAPPGRGIRSAPGERWRRRSRENDWS